MVRNDAAQLRLERQIMLSQMAAKMCPCPVGRLLGAFQLKTGLTKLKATEYMCFLADVGKIDFLDGEDTVYMPGQRNPENVEKVLKRGTEETENKC